MALRIKWDEYETALLIDACIKIDEGKLRTQDVVSDLSKKLRRRAIRQGIIIDEIFRNENGIAMQLQKIRFILDEKQGAFRHNTKVFIEMVNLFRKDREQFNHILEQAEEEIAMDSKQEDFFNWLSSRVSSSHLSDYFMAVSDLERFAHNKKMFAGSMFEVEDPFIIKMLISSIDYSSNESQYIRKAELKSMKRLAKSFHEYLMENASHKNEQSVNIVTRHSSGWSKKTGDTFKKRKVINTVSFQNVSKHEKLTTDGQIVNQILARKESKDSTDSPSGTSQTLKDSSSVVSTLPTTPLSVGDEKVLFETKTNPSPSVFIKTEKKPISDVPLNDDTLCVDYFKAENYSHTKPVYILYFGKRYNGSNWREILVRSAMLLCEDYPNVFQNLRNRNAAGLRGSLIYNTAASRTLLSPFEIERDAYIETHKSTADIIITIKKLLDYCMVDHKHLEIHCVKTINAMNSKQDSPTTRDSSSVSTDNNTCNVPSRQKSAYSYQKKNSHKEKHPGQIEFEEWLSSNNVPSRSVDTYSEAVERIGKYLKENRLEDRNIFSIRGLSRLDSILSKLSGSDDYRRSVPDKAAPLELYAFKKYISFRKDNNTSDIDDAVSKKYSEILRDNFENGFRITSLIDRRRFRQFYVDRFDTELSLSDDELVQLLQQIGTLQEGRVFVHEESAQNDLLDDIHADIARAFIEGASCIYYSEIFERYQSQLSEQLQIYSQDVMKALLLSTSYNDYYSSANYIFIRDRKPNPEEDIFRLMKRSPVPLTYGDIHEELWYVPIDIIKRSLVSIPELVNVAQGTYFYVRNLPLSAKELRDITIFIHRQLSQKNYMTDVELESLIRKELPSAAINLETFSTVGLRNCLSVLLGDSFSFSNGPIITEKGIELNVNQVFEDFCRAHSTLSFEELKSFAKEVNRGFLYLEPVMKVMVRISRNEYLNKDEISFDITATDAVLEELFEGEYMPIKDFKLFLHYPAISVRWNEFVLESYVAGYSRKFKLIHSNFTATECCGAIVREDSKIKDFQSLIIDVLAHSESWNTSAEALAILVKKGYLQRRRYSNIETILPEAKLLREKLLAESGE